MTPYGDFKTGFHYLQATGMEELGTRGTEVEILALVNFLSAPIYLHKDGKWHVYWSRRMKPFHRRGGVYLVSQSGRYRPVVCVKTTDGIGCCSFCKHTNLPCGAKACAFCEPSVPSQLSADGRDYQPDVECYDSDIGYYEPDTERYEFEARYRERWTLGNEDVQLESGAEDEGARPADRRTRR